MARTRKRKALPQHLLEDAPRPRPLGLLDVEPGTKVGYAARFLHSICVPPTDDAWRLLGEVVEVDGEFANVVWQDGHRSRVHRSAIAVPGPNLRWVTD